MIHQSFFSERLVKITNMIGKNDKEMELEKMKND